MNNLAKLQAQKILAHCKLMAWISDSKNLNCHQEIPWREGKVNSQQQVFALCLMQSQVLV